MASIEYVCPVLDSFHHCNELTCDLEQNGKIDVLDILLSKLVTLCKLYIEKVPIIVCIYTGILLH